MAELLEYEMRVLQHIHAPHSDNGVIYGAAMSEAIETLQSKGLVTRGFVVRITEAGHELLEKNGYRIVPVAVVRVDK